MDYLQWGPYILLQRQEKGNTFVTSNEMSTEILQLRACFLYIIPRNPHDFFFNKKSYNLNS